ncbi:glycosyltransferase family 4 protein [Bacillus paranthracis]|uniref:glycosyltransferase family 4 protein n=1 Tax=Bacillus paranthracis TaxID=2026186 RepID=UPI0021D0049F|nr:glycosyltransferase family 4 protein [Bacillus paranthracis]MCU5174421.1 glycosyltransferase family 4 protein [Bacillus paranthracis]
MKKILYVAHENTKGGATHSLINILDHLPKHIKPYVLIPKTLRFRSYFTKEYRSLFNAGTLEEELEKRKIPYFEAFYFLDNINVKQNLIRESFFSIIRSRELNRIKKQIQKEDIKIIHSNSSVIKFGADLAHLCNLKHLWHVRESVGDIFDISEEHLRVYKNNIVNGSEEIIFVSQKMKSDFIEDINSSKYEKKIKQIYNGVPLRNSNMNIKTDREIFNIYSFGTVYEIKGQEDLVYLAKRMKEDGITRFSIKIVGAKKAAYYEYLLSLIKKYRLEDVIEFIDYTNNLELLRKDASVEIVSSRSEAFGRVAVEAMNFGNLVIATPVGGLKEIITDKQTGLQYNPGDINKLYENILLIINKEIDIEKIKENAYQKSKEFDIQRCVSEICKLY